MGPNVLGIGCAKAGTTSIAKKLMESPDVHFPSKKEMHFWDKENFACLKIPFYYSHFISKKRVRMEFTPSYIMDRYARYRIKKHLSNDMRFIVILRDPVYRAYSHFWHAIKNWTPQSAWVKKRGYPVESRTFKEAIENECESLIFEPYHTRHLSYFSKGLYNKQLLRWLELFNRDQFYIILFEELIDSNKTTLKNLSEWLEIRLKDYSFFKSNSQTSFPLERETYDWLYKKYERDIIALNDNFGVDVSRWQFKTNFHSCPKTKFCSLTSRARR